MLIDDLIKEWLPIATAVSEAIHPETPPPTHEEFEEIKRDWARLGDPYVVRDILTAAEDSSRVRRNLEDEIRVLELRLKNSEEARERLQDVRDGNVWYWQGAENHLESLSLDVIIKPSELLELLRKP